MAISVHEFCHALAAWSLGDRTAQAAGRLTLNPLKHLDPMGTLLLLITIFARAPGIGWGKPVPVDPYSLRFGRLGMAIVSAAGPLSNIAIALAAALAIRSLLSADIGLPDWGVDFLQILIILNVGLAVFNLLPLAPLDGFGVLVGVLPWSVARPIARLAQYGPGILLLLVFSGSFIGVNLLSIVLEPPRRALFALVLRAAGAS